MFLPVFPNPPLASGVYLQDVTENSAILARIEPQPRILVAEVRDRLGDVVGTVTSGPTRRHAITISGLRADRQYTFTLADASGSVVDQGRFKTRAVRDDAVVHFLVAGDSGKVPWWVWLQDTPALHLPARLGWFSDASSVVNIGKAMASHPVDSWFHVGDVVYPYGEHRHYASAFFRPFGDLLRKAPCYPVLGNHDQVREQGRPYTQNFLLPPNAETGDRRMFSFRDGPVRFIGLDLNRVVDEHNPALRYLESELSAATEPWTIVFGHYPVFSASRQADRLDLIQHLVPILQRHKVDVYFCGHDHNYQRFHEEGGPVYVVTGGGGKSLYELREHSRLDAAFSTWQFTAVEVDGPVLRIQCVDVEGTVLDRVVLDKRTLPPDRLFRDQGESPRDRRLRALVHGSG